MRYAVRISAREFLQDCPFKLLIKFMSVVMMPCIDLYLREKEGIWERHSSDLEIGENIAQTAVRINTIIYQIYTYEKCMMPNIIRSPMAGGKKKKKKKKKKIKKKIIIIKVTWLWYMHTSCHCVLDFLCFIPQKFNPLKFCCLNFTMLYAQLFHLFSFGLGLSFNLIVVYLSPLKHLPLRNQIRPNT